MKTRPAEWYVIAKRRSVGFVKSVCLDGEKFENKQIKQRADSGTFYWGAMAKQKTSNKNKDKQELTYKKKNKTVKGILTKGTLKSKKNKKRVGFSKNVFVCDYVKGSPPNS
jgi:hypothetical protein